MNTNRRLTRSSTDRMLGGVCGGLANYLGVDSTLVRIGFVLLTLSGLSPLVYLILWVVIPSDTSVGSGWAQQVQQSIGEMQERATTVANEVSTRVNRGAGGNQASATGRGSSDQDSVTGPTTRL